MKIIRLIFKFILGIIFASLSWIALSPFFASLAASGSQETFEIFTYVISLIVIVFVTLGSSVRRSFGRGFLLTGICFFLLPISTTFLSVEAAGEVINNVSDGDQIDAATVAGAALGGGLVVLIGGFFGFFLGTIFLIVGLIFLLGGRKEVIIVENRVSPSISERKTVNDRIEPTFTRKE